jgi:hypothetical protein
VKDNIKEYNFTGTERDAERRRPGKQDFGFIWAFKDGFTFGFHQDMLELLTDDGLLTLADCLEQCAERFREQVRRKQN